MKKTAGQKFLKWYNNYVKEFGCSPNDYNVNYFWKHINLETEKQQIIEAFEEGQEYEYQYHINSAPKFYAETYYNETFK